MRLNFWQWLGLALLIGAVIWIIWRDYFAKKPQVAPPPVAVVVD